MARSDIEKMLERKERRGEPRLISMLADDLRQIGKLWDTNSDRATEFADFIPMRTVTIIEVGIREVIRELVDSGPPYLDRAEILSKGARLDFALLSGLQGRKLSVGDLVAHTISINEPRRILAYMEELIPGFVEKLKASHERWIEEEAEWPLAAIISDYDDMLRQLSRVFTVRHILTHELPRDPAFDPAEIPGFVAAGGEFLSAIDWVLVQELKGAVARTQTTMNMRAGDTMRALELQMADMVAAIEKRGGIDVELLQRSQDAWQAYARAEADFHASLVAGGSMYPMVWASAQSENIRRRIDTLRWWEEREEGDL
jgi:uncharacterized protein YecT (DUF1311 family)